MPASVEALGILLLLLPGFACALILQSIAIRVKQTELEKIIEALVLSFVLYLVTLPFFGYTLPVSWTVSHDGSFANYVIRLHWRHLLALGGGAVVLAFLYGANVNRDWLLRVLRRFKVTERTARRSIWNDAFQDISQSYLNVGLEDGRSQSFWKTRLGWTRRGTNCRSVDPEFFSPGNRESCLFRSLIRCGPTRISRRRIHLTMPDQLLRSGCVRPAPELS